MGTCCADRWVVEEWGPCSKTCGKLGYQTRVVQCMQAQHNGTSKPVHSKHCTEDRPDTRISCNHTSCPAQWRTGAWSQVGKEEGQYVCCKCFAYFAKYILFCFKGVDQSLTIYAKYWEDLKYNNRGLLLSLFWQCSVTCGEGIQQRQVVCKASDNTAAECEGEKPEMVIICKLITCPGEGKINLHHSPCCLAKHALFLLHNNN